MAFIEQASHDQIGLKVKLPNGNVASRVLPVRIHELDTNDIKLCESVLGGVLRGVDFVYKSSGVNRPLRANEDLPQNNLNKTYYRDQLNKLANAIEDIIESLKEDKTGIVKEMSPEKEQKALIKEGVVIKELIGSVKFNRISKKRAIILLIIFLSVFSVFTIYKVIDLSVTEKTIALIPLQNENNDSTLIENGDILLDAIRERLQKVNKITLIPRISCNQYRNTKKTISTIRKELNANYVIAGSVGREANNTIIRIELIKTKAIRFQKYLFDKDQIIKLSNEIIRDIISELNFSLSAEERNKIEMNPTKYDEAYQSFISANGISNDSWMYYNMGNKLLDSTSSISAIHSYDKAIKIDPLFALAYAKRAIARSWGFSIGQLDSTHIEKCREDIDKALQIDKELPDAQIALGFYYYYCIGDYNNALKYFKIAADQDPGNYQPMFYMAVVYRKMGDWEKSQSLINRVIKLNPQEALFLTNIGLSFDYLHYYDSALIYHQKAIDILPGWSSPYKNKIKTLFLKNGNTKDAGILLNSAIQKTGDNCMELRIVLCIYDGKYTEALQLVKQWVQEDSTNSGKKYIYLARISNLLNNPLNSRKYYVSALGIFNHDLSDNPTTAEIHSSISLAWAGMGDKEKAINESKMAIALETNNKLIESDMKINLAYVYAILGEYDNALGIIKELLSTPSCFSVKLMQLDPVWKPIFEKPEFTKILIEYSKN